MPSPPYISPGAAQRKWALDRKLLCKVLHDFSMVICLRFQRLRLDQRFRDRRLSTGRTHSNLKIIVNMMNRSDRDVWIAPKIVLDWEGGRSHSDIEPTETVDAWWSPSNPSEKTSLFSSRASNFRPWVVRLRPIHPPIIATNLMKMRWCPKHWSWRFPAPLFWGSELIYAPEEPANCWLPTFLFFPLSLPLRFIHLLWLSVFICFSPLSFISLFAHVQIWFNISQYRYNLTFISFTSLSRPSLCLASLRLDLTPVFL